MVTYIIDLLIERLELGIIQIKAKLLGHYLLAIVP